ncbi:DUF4132 domain-containing protein [Mycobacterium vicinigordonae]|uniref:DUF4132 domain-containing protein n=1 Tax=Mycobacterium vicinigordonae TaxID=1719132 RepID=A0A7D6E996_9MYCO|nr:DUF4132 domain-containing protein [Mycobacterium vicinigordonae]QLL09463.1 DUF4132 domain-containing protein [Mycobacterium vicinigordonae]
MPTDSSVALWRETVRNALERWGGEADPRLGSDVAEYVVTGNARADLPERLAAAGQLQPLRLLPHDDGLGAVHALLDTMPAQVGLRWAEVVLRLKRHTLTLEPLAGGDAIENLICDLVGDCGMFTPKFPDLAVGYDTLDEIVVAAGGRRGELLAAAFSKSGTRPEAWMWMTRNVLLSTRGYADAVARHAAKLSPLAAAQTGEDMRLRVLELLEPLDGAQLAHFADTLATFVVEGNSEVAGKAERLCARSDRAAIYAAFQRQVTGRPARRAAALRATWRYADTDADRQWAKETARSDRAPSVRLIVDEWRHSPAAPVTEPASGWPVIDPAPTRAALETLFAQLNSVVESRDWGVNSPPLLGAADVQAVESMLRAGRAPDRQNPWPPHATVWMRDALCDFANADHVDMVVLLVVCHYLDEHAFAFLEFADAVHAKRGAPTLADLAALLGDLTEHAVTALVYHFAIGKIGRGWPAVDVLPFVTANAQYLVESAMKASYLKESPAVYWDTLAALPGLPADVTDSLYSIALGPASSGREEAQRILADASDRRARIYTALADGRAKVRLAAAQWMAGTADESDVPRLETCLRIEADDRVRGALLDALTAAGRTAAGYLTPDHLIAESEAALRSDPPASLSWLLWERVPVLHWDVSGAPAPASVVRWLIVTACRANDPAPDAGLRHHLGLFAADDRVALADFLLDAWTTADEYAFHSSKTAQQTVSAIKSKGVLAVVAACGSPNTPALASEFIRHWDTMRMAQCGALMTMLSHIDSVEVVRILTSVPYWSKSARLIEEAAGQLAKLPTRRGWSPDEAADRTVPYVGFDPAGRLQLCYGDVPYFAALQGDLSVAVYDGDGNICAKADLAGPDAILTVTRKNLARVRKLVAPVVAAQTDRLTEAMRRKHRWSGTDFERFIIGHPVLSRLARRLVWVAETDGGSVLFTVPGSAAEPAIPAGAATVRIACVDDVPPGQTAQLRTAITAVGAAPLFEQFG